ncbi:sulfatase [Pararcticibacter amylolyticus]|uniref:Sulfatase n=1 Tax=Pararcticibacter amylolyticus TaxID=2173175 RepID=A0A2U2PGP9_9SPHI|nr:sulfatase [Pararcticibacter amylolyticus]
MFKSFFRGRYSILSVIIVFFISISFLLRTGLLLNSLSKTGFTFWGILHIYLRGVIYDFAVSLFLTALYNVYLLFLPSKWGNTLVNRLISYLYLFIILSISFFSFFAEITFWQEFESRFNFIAVDYLVYTYEVIHNINESYPLPLLLTAQFTLVLAAIVLFRKTGIFKQAFHSDLSFKRRILASGSLFILTFALPLFLSNSDAETSDNRYENELAKAGIYSFFAAFKNNELSYTDFYALLPKPSAYKIIRDDLKPEDGYFLSDDYSIKRVIHNSGPVFKPNVIMITIESMSADFMEHFGNGRHLTPVLDSLAENGMLFSNMYATGTRTVRGMEALSLSVPPTPGSSIVRRQGNEKLNTTGHIFEEAGYVSNFYYGGDGYFDNMNQYFGSNGYTITDRGRNVKLGDNYRTRRTRIRDSEVHFENAWGICDEDLFNAVIQGSDADSKKGKPFYDFVMTTSNHRPFTFPLGKIQMQPGTRDAAVRYTDYAIGSFLKKIEKKPWYKNTVIIIVADHCASSAGKNEIDISKYHIPCIMLNVPGVNQQVFNKICSQIDIYPTLFSLLHWTYESSFYGKNVLDSRYVPRAFMGTYQKLSYLRQDSLVILSPRQKVETYLYDRQNDGQKPHILPKSLTDMAIASYQSAYDLFKSGKLHQSIQCKNCRPDAAKNNFILYKEE